MTSQARVTHDVIADQQVQRADCAPAYEKLASATTASSSMGLKVHVEYTSRPPTCTYHRGAPHIPSSMCRTRDRRQAAACRTAPAPAAERRRAA
jgi:hypothetical protein